VKLIVNGTTGEFDVTTLTELLTQLVTTTRGSAAAVDGEVVPRAEWPTFALSNGQSIEILTAVQGG
jgi:sulfur carrier protein